MFEFLFCSQIRVYATRVSEASVRAAAVVRLTVTRDDTPPAFSDNSVVINIREDQTLGTSVGSVLATHSVCHGSQLVVVSFYNSQVFFLLLELV